MRANLIKGFYKSQQCRPVLLPEGRYLQYRRETVIISLNNCCQSVWAFSVNITDGSAFFVCGLEKEIS